VIELSTASLREARRHILWLAIVIAAAALLCGVALAWQLARRIARRLSAIANVATSVARGDLDHEPLVDTEADEIGALASAFNAMLEQMKQHHERLERLVAERTAQLEERTAEMQLVFDHVAQGLMIVELDGTIAADRSAAVERWLGVVPASANLRDYIEAFASERAAWFALQWDALREDILPLELSLAQLPARFDVVGRNLEFAYQPLSDGGRLRILVVVTDVTARELRRSAERDERESSTLVARMARGRSLFLAFHAEAASYVEIVKTADVQDTGFRRAVHTLKGVCGLEGLESIAEMCHDLETAIAEGDYATATGTCAAIAARWVLVTEKIRPLMDVVADRIDVSRGDLARFDAAVTRGAARGELVEMVDGWADERVAGRLHRFAEDAAVLAQRLGKAPLTVAVDVEDGLRLSTRWAPFWAAFVHAIRNAIDHGVEAPEARTRHLASELVLRAKHVRGEIEIEVEDFGAGIDWAAIEASARAKGLPAATQPDLEAALFADGISTRAIATETSGRGVGMAVLRQACEGTGGHVEVVSQPGRGTTLRFSWPWPPSHVAHQLAV
jgi:two-component system chemotaxis sensor kinase CheA